jgi:hypothetical protein
MKLWQRPSDHHDGTRFASPKPSRGFRTRDRAGLRPKLAADLCLRMSLRGSFAPRLNPRLLNCPSCKLQRSQPNASQTREDRVLRMEHVLAPPSESDISGLPKPASEVSPRMGRDHHRIRLMISRKSPIYQTIEVRVGRRMTLSKGALGNRLLLYFSDPSRLVLLHWHRRQLC